MKERRRTIAEEWRVSDAARGKVTWMAASGARSSGARVGPSDGSRVDVNCMGSLRERSSVSSVGASQQKRTAVIRKESAQTQDYVSCHDMEVDDDKSLEDIGFVPSVVGNAEWREPLRVKYMCDKKCNEEGCKFL